MGAAASTGPADREMVRILFDPANGFAASRAKMENAPGCDALAAYCILGGQPHRYMQGREVLKDLRSATNQHANAPDQSQQCLDRSMGCVLGNAVGDALGAPLEFSPVQYDVKELTGMCHASIWDNNFYNKFDVKLGQWTDDSAMALCIADSLLCCGGFDGIDLRQRFHLWCTNGYNNAFGRDPDRQSRASVGLGGNISESIFEWQREADRRAQTAAGDKFTSGNGSVMRNGALPVWFRNDIEAGMASAYKQSKTTHGGEEAAELCRLLTYICTRFINGADRSLLDDLSEFSTSLYMVRCLAASECEETHPDNSDAIFGSLENRQWNWRSSNFRYCEQRATENPGYIGSYAMDCMAMALHCVYSTRTFEEATLKAANLRGDSDSACAVVGQLAGALYGASSIPTAWLDCLHRWDGGSIAARALMLHNHEVLPGADALSDAACDTAGLLATTHLYVNIEGDENKADEFDETGDPGQPNISKQKRRKQGRGKSGKATQGTA